MADPAHVKLQDNSLYCAHCGERYNLPVPMPIYMFTATTNAFIAEHGKCSPSKAVAARDRLEEKASMASPHAWIAGRDTGLSSKTIWGVMMGALTSAPYAPCDPSDFGRCYRLLKAFPAWRDRLAEVANAYPEWAPLVMNWDIMTAIYERDLASGESAELFSLMQKLNDEGRLLRAVLK